MLVDWTDNFQRTLDRLEALKAQGDPDAAETVNLLDWQLEQLENLDGEPIEETPTFKEVLSPCLLTTRHQWVTCSMDSVGSRADAEIDAFIREHMGEPR